MHLLHLLWEAGERRQVTGQVKDFRTAVAAEKVSSNQTHRAEIITVHLCPASRLGSSIQLLMVFMVWSFQLLRSWMIQLLTVWSLELFRSWMIQLLMVWSCQLFMF